MSFSPSGLIPILLAGGRGTRIAHLHPNLPKPALPVAGRPFLAWILAQLAKVGFQQVVVSSGYLAGELRRAVEPFVPQNLQVGWVVEENPLGTGGGAAWAAQQSGWLPKAWLVMNGDSYLTGSWPEKIRQEGAATIVAREVADTGRFGRLEEKAGQLVRFSEKTGKGPGLINAGIYRVPRGWLEEIPRSLTVSMEMELFPGWLREGKKIRVLRESGALLDIGTPESLAGATDFARRHFTF